MTSAEANSTNLVPSTAPPFACYLLIGRDHDVPRGSGSPVADDRCLDVCAGVHRGLIASVVGPPSTGCWVVRAVAIAAILATTHVLALRYAMRSSSPRGPAGAHRESHRRPVAARTRRRDGGGLLRGFLSALGPIGGHPLGHRILLFGRHRTALPRRLGVGRGLRDRGGRSRRPPRRGAPSHGLRRRGGGPEDLVDVVNALISACRRSISLCRSAIASAITFIGFPGAVSSVARCARRGRARPWVWILTQRGGGWKPNQLTLAGPRWAGCAGRGRTARPPTARATRPRGIDAWIDVPRGGNDLGRSAVRRIHRPRTGHVLVAAPAGYFAAFFLRSAQEAVIRSETAFFSSAVIGRRFLVGLASDAVSATGVAAAAGRREEERRAAGFAGAEVTSILSTSFNAWISPCKRSISLWRSAIAFAMTLISCPRSCYRPSLDALWAPAERVPMGSDSSPTIPASSVACGGAGRTERASVLRPTSSGGSP